MSDDRAKQPLFSGLVYNEAGELAETAYVGDEPQYVILDAGFRRHVSSEQVDRQVLRMIQQQIAAHEDMITESAMAMLGKDDLFTKAVLDSSIRNMEELAAEGIPDDARTWLGMMGFRITVDIHGNVVDMTGLDGSEAE